MVTKGNLWQSNDSWTFSNLNGTFAHIKNTSNKTVLAETDNFVVDEGVYAEAEIQEGSHQGRSHPCLHHHQVPEASAQD